MKDLEERRASAANVLRLHDIAKKASDAHQSKYDPEFYQLYKSGDNPDGDGSGFGSWLKAIATDDKDGILSHYEVKTLEAATGAAGGFLVPIQYRAQLLAVRDAKSIVRPRATIFPMDHRQLQIPSLDQTITPSAPKSAFYGGVVAEWIEEGATKPEHEPDFKLVTLTAHEAAFIVYVTEKLARASAQSVDVILRTLFGGAMASFEDWHFLNGGGVGMPQGVISAGATIQPNRAVNNQICWADIVDMVHAHLPGPGSVFVAHLCTREQLYGLVDGAGNYMWIPNARTGQPTDLAGFPIIFTERVPNLGTKGDIGLYDFSYYLVGDAAPVTVESSEHYRFTEDIVTYRAKVEVDGKPWLSEPMELMPDGSVEVSPFVALDVA